MAASIAVEEVLLLLKIAFLVLLYLFIWRVVRTAARDLRSAPQESIVLAPERAQERRRRPLRCRRRARGGLVVVASPALAAGQRHELDSAPLTIGREPLNDLALPGDEFASARHARLEPRPDGVWIEDVGSTNGTYVNGVRLTAPTRLVPGDLIRVGETDLRFER